MSEDKPGLKPCKYCGVFIPKNHRKDRTMCNRCRRIHYSEYSRLYKSIRRNGLILTKQGAAFKLSHCPFCFKAILGRKICRECAGLREKICDTLIAEIEKEKGVMM